MSTFKKLFASVAAVMVVASTVPANVFAASYSNEQQDAYDYAFGAGLTTQATIDGARLNDSITRAELAKVASVAAEAQGLSLDTSASCSFNDTASLQGSDLLSYVTKACQYGLMGVNTNGVFNPSGLVTRAELAAVIDRILNGDANVGGNPWYAGHMASLQDAGIMNDISNPSSLALRFHAFVMFQRADEGGTTPAVCQDPMVQLSCALGLDDCPAECSGDEEEEEEEPTFTGEGTLSVELSSDTPEGGKVPANVDGLVIATFDLTASDDADVRVDSITLDRLGYSNSDTISGYVLVSKSAGRISKIKGDNSEGEVALSVEVSSDTPDSATIPGSVAGVTVASFDFSASNDGDIKVNSVKLKRYGVSSDANTLEGLALSHESGRLTDSKNESSNGEVTLSIQGGLVVKAGHSETINVLV